MNRSTSTKRRLKAVALNGKVQSRNNVTVNMNYKTMKRPKSRILNLRNTTENNRMCDKIKPSISTISKIQLNEHALK